MKINSMQAPSTLIPEYIGSSFDAVLEVASNIEAVKVVAENVDTFGVPLASETTTGIAEIATQAEVNQKTNDSHIVTPKKLGAYAAPLVHNHATATSTESGFLSATDKQKLDGIASNANNYTHPTSSVTAGTYKSVTVNAQGHITAGTNPTTLSGYGITDAVLLSDVATTATASKILKLDANSKLPASITGNATTATKLATARTINGVPFDGSENITINAVDSTSWIASSEKGVANGVATLGADGKISSSQLPSYTAGAVDSVAGKTGVVTLVKADVGLGNVDNTSDINKPISTAQQSALNLKANLASPALTGTPSAPTATVGTSTSQIATTAFVNAEIANDAAPKSHVGSTGTSHGVATTSVAGFMSAADKIKLDSMGSGGDYTHPVSGVTAGTYKSVTVDVNGHVTSGTNPTTLVGYGITDAINTSARGAVNGVASLDAAGLVPTSQLPSYVDDVLEYANLVALPVTGEAGKIYVTSDDNKIFRWSGSTYIEISPGAGNSDSATKLTTARTISTTGDATWAVSFDGSANVSSAITLSNSGASAGTYRSVTVDAKGRVTSGTNPTTLAGYGITDAQALYADLTAIAALSGTSGLLKKTAANTWSLDTNAYITGNQSITISGDVSGSGTTSIALTLANSGVAADTYKSVTVDTKGRVTAGTNPTTLAGYGITDATPSSHIGSTGSSHGLATTSVAGFMSAADKTKLDGLSGGGSGDQTITLTGDVTGSGTGSFATTLANSGVTAGTYPKVTVDAKGRVTAGASLAASDIPSLSWSKITSGKPTTLSGYGITDAVVNTTTINGKPLTTNITLTAADVGATGATVATTTTNGLMSSTDKLKLDGIEAGADKYVHPSEDGNLHVPPTGTTNDGKFLKAGSTAKSFQWSAISKTDVGLYNVDNTSDLNKPISTATQTALNGKANTTHTHTAADVGALSSTGTAAAATKLATARTIAGKSFDGTANISITAADVGALSTSGGKLIGNLDVQGIIRFTDTVASAGISNYYGRNIVRGSNQAINVFGNDTDAMYFDGNSLTAWQVRYNGTLYKIYHTGNKPTPAEIGAQPATSDSRVKSNIASLSPVLDKIMLIDPKTFTMEGRDGTCVGTIAQDWEVDFPEVILNVPSTSQGEPEMLKGIDALGTIGILLKAIQELKGEIEDLKNR